MTTLPFPDRPPDTHEYLILGKLLTPRLIGDDFEKWQRDTHYWRNQTLFHAPGHYEGYPFDH